MDSAWLEVGDGVFQRRYDPLDVSIGIIVGEAGLSLIDTRNNPGEARQLLADIQERFALPVRAVINTHAHYDHSFGNQVFAEAGVPIYGHRLMPRHLADVEGPHLARVQADPQHEPDKHWAEVRLTAPTELVAADRWVQLCGRKVLLSPLAAGHTDSDLVVYVADAGVWFLGDTVEESGPPMFGPDSDPAGWARVLAALVERLGPHEVLIPGHGQAVDRNFVLRQARAHAALAQTLHRAQRRGIPAGQIQFPAEVTQLWPADFLADAVRAFGGVQT